MKPIPFRKSLSALILYYKGPHDDDEDTVMCAKGIAEALRKRGHAVKKICVTEKNWRKAAQIPGDVVFNLVEDDDWKLYLRVGHRLEQLGRVQVGHDMKSFRYSINKASVKRKMAGAHVNTPAFKIFNRRSPIRSYQLSYPLIVKPSRQHAGIGISQDSVVNNLTELKKRVAYLFSHYPGEVIVEEFIKGREIHVTILGNGENVMTLPYCEIGFGKKSKDKWNIYTYEAKWDKKSWEYWNARVKSPPLISPRLHEKMQSIAIKAYTLFNCRDMARLDFRINSKNIPYIVDLNINPSLNYYDEEDATIISVYTLKWTYDQFIETLASMAYQRVLGS
ncbi:MAG: D-ala D-ala ligase C-terminus family [uncultured bacterium]|nr:MAG: D-ala D-ala ligase C-terminus family [uncultured bacterium]